MKTKSSNTKKSKIQLFIYIGGLAAIVIATIYVCMNREVKSSQYEYKDHNYDVEIIQESNADGQIIEAPHYHLTQDNIYSNIDKVDWENVNAGTEIWFYTSIDENGVLGLSSATRIEPLTQKQIESLEKNMNEQERMTVLTDIYTYDEHGNRSLIEEKGAAMDAATQLIMDKNGQNITSDFNNAVDNMNFLREYLSQFGVGDWYTPTELFVVDYGQDGRDAFYVELADDTYVRNMAKQYSLTEWGYKCTVVCNDTLIEGISIDITGVSASGETVDIRVCNSFLSHGI